MQLSWRVSKLNERRQSERLLESLGVHHVLPLLSARELITAQQRLLQHHSPASAPCCTPQQPQLCRDTLVARHGTLAVAVVAVAAASMIHKGSTLCLLAHP